MGGKPSDRVEATSSCGTDKSGRVVVANHPGTVLALKTLQSILEDAGISAEALRELL